MHAPAFQRVRSSCARSFSAHSAALLFAALAAACGGSSGGSGQSGITGEESDKPGGGFFIVDENQSGGAANLHLAEVLWGRLVDVHQIDANGVRVDPPVFEDFVISPNALSEPARWVLDRNPVTQKERLTILNIHGPDAADVPPEEDKFLTLLGEASDTLPLVVAKNDDGSASGFTTVPRNACMVLRFDDCLDDSEPENFVNTVKVFSGYLPTTPFAARVVIDPNHGALVGGSFHTTRVLVDMTISQIEAADPNGPALDVNAIGMPASLTTSSAANISVRIPSNPDVGSGQPEVLTNLSGVALDFGDNGPADPDSPTLDVVRAVQSGNSDDGSNGFLRDVDRPRVIGGWPITITAATDDGAGDPGFDFLIGLTFTTTCLNAPAVGDVVLTTDNFLQVTAAAPLAGSNVVGLQVRSAFSLGDPQLLLGDGTFEAPFLPSIPLAAGCWVSFLPQAATPPVTGVKTQPQILARFSEPMDPESLSPFGGFMVVKGAAGATTTAISSNLILGEVLLANRDLTAFSFEPNLALPHTLNSSETLHIELSEARDLAGNRLRHQIPFVDFTIAPLEETVTNGSIALRFDTNDEAAPNGAGPDGLRDLRGQFFYDQGVIVPRPVAFSGWPVDRLNPVPARMFAVAGGVFTPLNPLGAKLQMLWRYCDLGWTVEDETKYNLDVIGLNWSPVAGQVTSDFFDQFEIRLGHSRFLPDEGPPLRATSGLPITTFEDNYLAGSNPKIVHNRALGYAVNPAELFNAPSGTPMLPYPLNRGQGTDVTYTWRDTSILTLGADGDPQQRGIPLDAEAAALVVGPNQVGDFGRAGEVPTFGLPLLVEVRCHPSDQGLGFNLFGVSLGNLLGGTQPAFRSYTAGGIDAQGSPVITLPDSELFPRGVLGSPPGTALVADSVFYLGQLDTVVRVSRVHTVWLDAGTLNTQWQTPVLEPSLSLLPAGSSLLIDYRSANGFSVGGNNDPFDSSKIDPYGDQSNAPQSLSEWSSAISIGNERRFLQVRFTFLNNIESGVGPQLDAIGFPFVIQ